MHTLLFIFYSVVLCYLLRRMRFFRDSGIKPSMLVLLFGLRVAAACLHNIVAYRFYPNHGDIWAFFDVSFITRQELFHDFHRFWADNAIWAYLPYNTVIFLHILFNFLSFDNMYINTLFFSFGVFAGSIALFRAFRGFFRDDLLCALCVLLIPSTIYWTACIHKEGLIYLSLGFFFYYLQMGPAGSIRALFFFCLTAFFRPGIAIGVLIGSILWGLLRGLLWKRLRIVLALSLAGLIVLVVARPVILTNLLSIVSNQQSEFQALRGNSRIYLPALEPTPASFLHALPTATFNGFFQPWPGKGGQAVYLIFSIELILIWMTVIYSAFSLPRPKTGAAEASPGSPALPAAPDYSLTSDYSPGLLLCCLFYALSGMLLIGYTVPFAGAIIRYRSLYLPFLLAPFLHLMYKQPFYRKWNAFLSHFLLVKY